jgi:FkbM family methyltransferase
MGARRLAAEGSELTEDSLGSGVVRLPRHPIRSVRYRLGDPKHVFGRYVPEAPVIVEAGAHRGSETVRLAERWPGGQIHAFEPAPDAYDELVQNTDGHGNVKTYRLALSGEESTTTLWLGGASSSLRAPKEHLTVYPEVSFTGQASVEATTLEAWAAREGIDRVDGLWLDAQGNELAILQAAGPLLDTARAIVLEASKAELYEGAPIWPDVRRWLRQRGFRMRASRWDSTGIHGDVLVVKR